MPTWKGPRGSVRTLRLALVAAGLLSLSPSTASAHSITGRVDLPIPFVAYIAAAAIAVAASFFIMAAGDPGPPRIPPPGRVRIVPRWSRLGLRGLGLIAWLWIVAQAITGGSSDADVASLFLWVYGWVGLALVSAFLGPVWSWIDPFTTIHDIIAGVGHRLGLTGLAPQPWPRRLGLWIAVGGLVFFVWLELVAKVLQGRPLALVLVGYTAITLLGMAQYGRDPWRQRAETFSVWFGVLGRLAPFALSGTPEAGGVVRRPIASGLVTSRWPRETVVMVAVGTGAIIYDGLSQTTGFFQLFGFPSIALGTLILAVVPGRADGVGAGSGAGGRPRGHGGGAAAGGDGLSHRALPVVPAHRRATHPDRRSRIPSSRRGTCSARHSWSRARRGCRPERCGASRWVRWSSATSSAPGQVMPWRDRRRPTPQAARVDVAPGSGVNCHWPS